MSFDSEKYERAITLIRDLEWAGELHEDATCPECGAMWYHDTKDPYPHKFDCRMVEFLENPLVEGVCRPDAVDGGV